MDGHYMMECDLAKEPQKNIIPLCIILNVSFLNNILRNDLLRLEFFVYFINYDAF